MAQATQLLIHMVIEQPVLATRLITNLAAPRPSPNKRVHDKSYVTNTKVPQMWPSEQIHISVMVRPTSH